MLRIRNNHNYYSMQCYITSSNAAQHPCAVAERAGPRPQTSTQHISAHCDALHALCQVAELEKQGASACPAHGMHLDPAVYGQLQSLRWVANPPPAVSESIICDVAYGMPMPSSCVVTLNPLQYIPRCLPTGRWVIYVPVSSNICNCTALF